MEVKNQKKLRKDNHVDKVTAQNTEIFKWNVMARIWKGGWVPRLSVSTADPISPYANLYINSSDLYYGLYLI